eukprot:3284928-Amphidinium_carterae.1
MEEPQRGDDRTIGAGGPVLDLLAAGPPTTDVGSRVQKLTWLVCLAEGVAPPVTREHGGIGSRMGLTHTLTSKKTGQGTTV